MRSNRHRFPLALAALVAFAGCSKSEPSPSPTAEGELPRRFSPFTVETIKGLEGLAQVGDSWQEARDKLDARLGMSTYAIETEQAWAVAEGGSCWMTTLEVEDGKVKTIQPPTELKAVDGIRYQHCVAAWARNRCFRDGTSPVECTERFPPPQ